MKILRTASAMALALVTTAIAPATAAEFKAGDITVVNP